MECVLFFELTVAKDVRRSKYPQLDDESRLTLILDRMSKWFGHTVRIDNERLMASRDFKGTLEYILVSSRTTADGILHVGARKKEAFPWIKVMDRNDLKSIFPKAQIETLALAMADSE
jgi:hypothetical protein